MSIYISSAASRRKRIGEAVAELAEHGFTHIELTGGTRYYPEFENDLLMLRDKYSLYYLAHNYFPPPCDDFVLNLASDDEEIYRQSLDQLKRSLDFCRHLDIPRFGFHAGFFVAPTTETIGQKMTSKPLPDQSHCLRRFSAAVKELVQASGSVTLYVENNVYSQENYSVFGDTLPFMGLRYNDFFSLLPGEGCKALLDIAHLYVTATTLGFSFSEELAMFLEKTDYVHLSFNNGYADQNHGISERAGLFRGLDVRALRNKTVTLEIYDGIDVLHRSKDLIEKWMKE